MVEKKKFFDIELPIINEQVSLLAVSEESLIGKTIKIDMTRKLKGKSLDAIFVIKEKLKAEMKRICILGYFIRRMMRTSINYVEDSFSAESKNAFLRIKPFLITRKKVTREVRKALRNKAKEEILAFVKDKNADEIFSSLLSGTFQRTLSLKLKKIYPLSFCDIRDIFIEKELSPLVVEEKIQ